MASSYGQKGVKVRNGYIGVRGPRFNVSDVLDVYYIMYSSWKETCPVVAGSLAQHTCEVQWHRDWPRFVCRRHNERWLAPVQPWRDCLQQPGVLPCYLANMHTSHHTNHSFFHPHLPTFYTARKPFIAFSSSIRSREEHIRSFWKSQHRKGSKCDVPKHGCLRVTTNDLEKIERRYLCNVSSDPLHVWF